MIRFSLLLYIINITYFVDSHGDHRSRQNLVIIYTEGLNKELSLFLKDKINASLNLLVNNARDSNLRSILTGCKLNLSVSHNCSCTPIWISLKESKIKTALIGLPEKLLFDFSWPSQIIDDSVLEIPFSSIMKRLMKSFEDEEISFAIICIHKKESVTQVKNFFMNTTLNSILFNAPSADDNSSSVIFTGSMFVESLKSKITLQTTDISSLVFGFYGINIEQNCENRNQSVLSILKKHLKERDFSTLFIIAVIIGVCLLLSLVMVVASVCGVFARKQKSNRFNLGARLDSDGPLQPERNYLLDSSDDDELFSDPARDLRQSATTVLRIHDNLSDIALH